MGFDRNSLWRRMPIGECPIGPQRDPQRIDVVAFLRGTSEPIERGRRGKLALGIANGSVFADDACVYLARDMRVGLIASAT